MHQREQQHATTATGLHVLVHSGLKPYFDSPQALLGALRSGLDRVDFVDAEELTAPCGALDLPVLMPVTSEFQAEELRAVRVRHPLSLLVAVTNDVSGYRTYYAIRSGANFVLNLAIPSESQRDLLYAQLRAHLMAGPADSMATAGPQGLPADQGGRQRCRYHGGETPAGADGDRESDIPGEHLRAALPSHDAELMRLLCTSITVSEIARRYYYCSERSMYRRIRRLYDDLGVGGRAELISLATVPDPRRPLTARAC
ncbi:DNA-binding response regulator [Streptomyces sp. NPDC057963]|uniref:helix-turn-helix transcriptional regulator n=1 Tax=Streptomyces sp. NPDC057963 TaxID=3346290 RepID=UPI0036EB9AEF